MRLLVIEDERDLCEDIAKKLRLSGYEADTCVDGEAALELLAVERYDLVLLDLNLPKVDGMTGSANPAGARSGNRRADPVGAKRNFRQGGRTGCRCERLSVQAVPSGRSWRRGYAA